MTTLLIVGAGGHGRDLAATARNLNMQTRIVDDNPDLWIPPPPTWDGPWTIGIGDPNTRQHMSTRYPQPAATLIDPNAHVAADTGIEEGVTIGPGVTLTTECTIGRHTHICYGAQFTRATIGAYVTIGPGATFCGYAHVGDRTYIGAGAILINKIRVGNDCIIGAGSVVINDIPNGTTVKGNPAR